MTLPVKIGVNTGGNQMKALINFAKLAIALIGVVAIIVMVAYSCVGPEVGV